MCVCVRAQICLVELGGTVGDIESAVFLEAFRQFRYKNDPADTFHIHLCLVRVAVAVGCFFMRRARACVCTCVCVVCGVRACMCGMCVLVVLVCVRACVLV